MTAYVAFYRHEGFAPALDLLAAAGFVVEDVSAVRNQPLGRCVRGHDRGVRTALGVRWGQGEAHQRSLGAPGATQLSRSSHQRGRPGQSVPEEVQGLSVWRRAAVVISFSAFGPLVGVACPSERGKR